MTTRLDTIAAFPRLNDLVYVNMKLSVKQADEALFSTVAYKNAAAPVMRGEGQELLDGTSPVSMEGCHEHAKMVICRLKEKE